MNLSEAGRCGTLLRELPISCRHPAHDARAAAGRPAQRRCSASPTASQFRALADAGARAGWALDELLIASQVRAARDRHAPRPTRNFPAVEGDCVEAWADRGSHPPTEADEDPVHLPLSDPNGR